MPMGWDELAIIIVLAIIIIGPQRMPEYAAKLARGIRQMRVMADGARSQLRDQMGPEFEDINWRQYDPRQYDPRKIVRDALREPLEAAWNPVAGEIDSVRHSAAELRNPTERTSTGATAMSAADLAGEQVAAAPTPRPTPYDVDAT